MFFLLHAIFLFCFYELRYVKTQLQRRTPQSTGTFLKFLIYLRTYNIYVYIQVLIITADRIAANDTRKMQDFTNQIAESAV